MKTAAITLVLLGMLWAGTTSAAPQKRGCSAYGHSCFGGYGKRAGGGAGVLVAPLPPPQPRGADGDPTPERLPYLRSLRSPQDDDEAAFIVLRQSPVSSRTPLWGRPAAASTRTYHGEDDDNNGETVSVLEGGGGLGGGAVPAAERRADSAEEAEQAAEPYTNINHADRLFLRRWLRTYRRASDRAARGSARE
ncbi:CCHamide-2 [Frankliniella occidentalis]|uniref:Uncharacterized protein LOC113206382 n=1 Tax=Frankliniella occidentalis TaxID=133901 RepID=A0A6J1SAZ5_FRAOC|nr:uncharacterized protein LOC113206382 [Frankliniella occidentalis]KAE8747153.1 CCHamide-2 [Frankliniella occidentalis]